MRKKLGQITVPKETPKLLTQAGILKRWVKKGLKEDIRIKRDVRKKKVQAH
jgi:hypothetical protein